MTTVAGGGAQASASPAGDSARRAPEDEVGRRTRRQRRRLGLVVAAAALAVVCLLSLATGSKPLALDAVVEALYRDNGDAHAIVMDQRIPRTVLGLLVGLALAVAGALMQGMTRNPLADPGLLGVSAGAEFAIVVGALTLSGATQFQLVWFAFAGAIVTTVAVYLVAPPAAAPARR